MPDYNTSKIYKLQCDDGHFFIGSTCNELRFRMAEHKKKSKIKPDTRVFKHIGTRWDEVHIVLIENFPCESKEHLNRRKDQIIQQHMDNPLCLNSARASLTEEEKLNYAQNYHEQNRSTIAARKKRRYEEVIKSKNVEKE